MERGFLTESLPQYQVVSNLLLQVCRRITDSPPTKMLCIEGTDTPGRHHGAASVIWGTYSSLSSPLVRVSSLSNCDLSRNKTRLKDSKLFLIINIHQCLYIIQISHCLKWELIAQCSHLKNIFIYFLIEDMIKIPPRLLPPPSTQCSLDFKERTFCDM